MKIQVKLHAQLRKLATKKSGNPITFDVADGSRVRDVIAMVGIPAKKAKLIIVNGLRGKPGDKLTDGAVIDLFPPLAGG